MTETTRLPRTTLTGPLGRLLTTMMRRKIGAVPAGAEVMWHYPKVLLDMGRFGQRTERWDRLDHSLATLAAMAAAAEVGCGFCLDLHYFMAQDRGLDEEKAREVPVWRESSAFTATERRVLEYAEAMSRTPLTVTDELVSALREDLGDAGVVELTARVAFMNMSARGNVALGIPSEHYAEACGLRPLAAVVSAP